MEFTCKEIFRRGKLDQVDPDNYDEFDALADDLENDFEFHISRAYLEMLRKDYGHLISDKCVADNLRENEVEFMEDGTVFNN